MLTWAILWYILFLKDDTTLCTINIILFPCYRLMVVLIIILYRLVLFCFNMIISVSMEDTDIEKNGHVYAAIFFSWVSAHACVWTNESALWYWNKNTIVYPAVGFTIVWFSFFLLFLLFIWILKGLGCLNVVLYHE